MLTSLCRRRLRRQEAGLGQHATENQLLDVTEKSNSLRRQIFDWYTRQALYMPGAPLLRERDAREAKLEDEDKTQDLRLYLPSAVGSQIDCTIALLELEWLLRVGQAEDALEGIRASLRFRAHMDFNRKEGGDGVAANTRAQTEIKLLYRHIDEFAADYRAAYTAMLGLALALAKGIEWQFRFRLLAKEDLRPIPTDQKLGESRERLSWIWKEMGSDPADPKQVLEGELRALLFAY